MELFLYLIIGVVAYILFARISYKLWLVVFDTKFETLNKRMEIASKIFGVLWLISLPILLIITVISMFAHEK
jgi:cell division protein FtsX